MDSFELRIFNTVAEEKSITKAAINMGYVQSNVTAHIKKLELNLGLTLFTRHSNGVTLTAAGENLFEYSRKIIKLIDKSERDVMKKIYL